MGQREAVQSIWSSIGPGNIGGRTRSIIIHPTDPNIIWLGAVGGGVWKTTNAGSSWTTTTDFLANLAVNCMAIDPTNCNRLYAGTGEPYPFDGILGDRIFKTGDGGITWIQMSSTASNPDFQNVTRLAIAYYAPIRHTVLLVGTTTGLFRTTTDGIRWSQVRTGHINTLVFQPNNAANCLASIGLGGRYGNDFGGIFYSTDAGATWTLSTITTNKPVTGRVELAYAPSDPSGSIVYASADDYASPALSAGELLKSTNGGRTFAPTNITNTLDVIGWYANTLWVDPTNPYVVLVGGADLFRCTSTDGGITFNKVKIGGIDRGDHVDHHVIINDPNYNGSDNRIAFVATDGGIYNTNDILAPNVQWTSLNHTLGITQFYGGAANSTGDTIIGGTQDTGTLRYRSQYGSEQWDVMSGSDTNSASDGGFCAWTGGYFYGEYPVLGLYRSSDGSYANLQFIYGAGGGGNWAAPLIVDPNNPNTLLAGGLYLRRSIYANAPNPQDVNWTLIKSSQQGDDNISTITVAPGNSDIIWVGHNSGRIYVTTNGTAANPSWIRVDRSPLPQRYVESIAFAGWRPGLYNEVYVAFGGLRFREGFASDNLWRTTNSGSTWTNISNGLPSVPIRSVVTSQRPSYPGYLYIGSAVGIFASTDYGGTWSPGIAGEVPANVFVNQLFWTRNGTRLVAVTHGRGMFTADTN